MRQRTGLYLVLIGLVLAAVTAVLVMRIGNQATEASRSQLRQVNVVVTNRSILDKTTITADALAVKAFPADFAPPGALGTIDQAVGKFASGYIARNQILVADQVVPALPSPNLSDRVPPGKVAIWLPMPGLMASAGVLRPGDHIDILLSIGVGGTPDSPGGLTTQTTLQNVEVFRLGVEEIDLNAPAPVVGSQNGTTGPRQVPAPPGATPAPAPAAGAPAAKPGATPTPAAGVIGFLVDHQDALIIKFIKDSGGTIDLVLRSSDDQQVVRTDAVAMDVLTDRFRFRVPSGPIR
jgi:pilus assembly protein CpaB